MAKKLTKKQLETHLKQMKKDELIREISQLYTKFKAVKDYCQLEFGGEEEREAILKKYKKKVKDQFYTRSESPRYPSAATLRKLITEFKKVSPVPYDTAELMFHRMELAVDLTASFGDMDEPFYNSTETAWRELLALIEKEKLHQYFQNRCRELIDSADGIGWGFQDGLLDEYEQVFGYDEDY